MAKRRFKAPKDPFSALPEEFKDAVAQGQTEDLQQRLAEIAKSEEKNQQAAKADQDLKERVEAANLARRPYKESSKLHRLKTQFIIRVQADRGDANCQEILMLGASKV